MKRIFLTLAALSTLLLLAAFVLGLLIDDPAARESQAAVGRHIDVALAALVSSSLVHALALTYFMGTGRWLEETGHAYRLSDHWQRESRSLKYRTVPAMIGAFLLLLLTGALGSAADPASPVGFTGWLGLSAGMVHLLAATITVGVNLVVNLWEYFAIHRNGELIQEVLQEVRRIREERGLPV